MNSELIAKLLLEMVPGPSGQISQKSLLHFSQRVWDAAYKEGEYHGRMKELRLQAIPKEILRV